MVGGEESGEDEGWEGVQGMRAEGIDVQDKGDENLETERGKRPRGSQGGK